MGAASIGSALIGSSAANKAAKLQAGAARDAQALQLRMFEEGRGELRPYMDAGRGATASLAQLYGIDPSTGELTGQPFNQASLDAFRNSPDYEFARQEGLRGVTFGNAQKGLLKSGNNMRDLMSYGQGLATQNFGNYRGALQQLAQLGQGAAGSLMGNSTAVGANAANAGMQQGAALASGVVGSANAFNGALGNIGNYAMLQSFMNPSGSGSAYHNMLPTGMG